MGSICNVDSPRTRGSRANTDQVEPATAFRPGQRGEHLMTNNTSVISQVVGHSLGKAVRGVALCLAVASVSAPALASTVAGWWGGTWTCSIDGRPAQMKWITVDDSQQT